MRTRHWLALFLLIGLVAGAAADGGVPTLPQEFWGAVTIGGSPAPAGTVIAALIEGEPCGSVTTTADGAYGNAGRYDGERLVVSGNEEQAGLSIVFLVDGKEAGQTAAFTPGGTTRLDLAVAGSSSPSGGVSSSSGGTTATTVTTARSTTPPVSPRTATALATSSSGEVLATATFRTAGGLASLTVPAGTTALDGNGVPLEGVTIETADTFVITHVLPGMTMGFPISCGPDGAHFDPSVTLSYTFSEDAWPPVAHPSTMTVMAYAAATQTWQEVPTTVDAASRTVTAQISHFSVYALGWTTPAPSAVTTAPSFSATVVSPAPVEPTSSGNGTSLPVLAIAGIMIGAAGYFALKKK
ncbi:MAG: hypothetical protein PWP08_1805 [Methanofollis sp.]|nr:hypothetical protein [Methanofollis sp.]